FPLTQKIPNQNKLETLSHFKNNPNNYPFPLHNISLKNKPRGYQPFLKTYPIQFPTTTTTPQITLIAIMTA
ncbi:hypothetical protein, partial [Bacillus pumilus]|uniref:hypothetical protein n=1 Tax=Bacillus pumilus TaxID=1408 RepID=UPI003703DC6B